MVWVWVESGQVAKNTSLVKGQPVFYLIKKNQVRVRYFWVGSENSDPFCHVYSNELGKPMIFMGPHAR